MSSGKRGREESLFRVHVNGQGLTSSEQTSILCDLSSVESIEPGVSRREATVIISARSYISRRDHGAALRLTPDLVGTLVKMASKTLPRAPVSAEEEAAAAGWDHGACPSRADVERGLTKLLAEVKPGGVRPLPRRAGTCLPRDAVLDEIMAKGPISLFPEPAPFDWELEEPEDLMPAFDAAAERGLAELKEVCAELEEKMFGWLSEGPEAGKEQTIGVQVDDTGMVVVMDGPEELVAVPSVLTHDDDEEDGAAELPSGGPRLVQLCFEYGIIDKSWADDWSATPLDDRVQWGVIDSTCKGLATVHKKWSPADLARIGGIQPEMARWLVERAGTANDWWYLGLMERGDAGARTEMNIRALEVEMSNRYPGLHPQYLTVPYVPEAKKKKREGEEDGDEPSKKRRRKSRILLANPEHAPDTELREVVRHSAKGTLVAMALQLPVPIAQYQKDGEWLDTVIETAHAQDTPSQLRWSKVQGKWGDKKKESRSPRAGTACPWPSGLG